MKRIKSLEMLREQLLKFQDDIVVAIGYELSRIGRVVEIKELKANPFLDQVSLFVDALKADDAVQVICLTSFADIDEKSLQSMFSDSEIDYYGLVDMLAALKDIADKNDVLPTKLIPVFGESINHEDDWDTWVCLCGNMAANGGFYSCDETGNHIEGGDEGDFFYRCDTCGRVIDERDHKVIGINLNAKDQEE